MTEESRPPSTARPAARHRSSRLDPNGRRGPGPRDRRRLARGRPGRAWAATVFAHRRIDLPPGRSASTISRPTWPTSPTASLDDARRRWPRRRRRRGRRGRPAQRRDGRRWRPTSAGATCRSASGWPATLGLDVPMVVANESDLGRPRRACAAAWPMGVEDVRPHLGRGRRRWRAHRRRRAAVRCGRLRRRGRPHPGQPRRRGRAAAARSAAGRPRSVAPRCSGGPAIRRGRPRCVDALLREAEAGDPRRPRGARPRPAGGSGSGWPASINILNPRLIVLGGCSRDPSVRRADARGGARSAGPGGAAPARPGGARDARRGRTAARRGRAGIRAAARRPGALAPPRRAVRGNRLRATREDAPRRDPARAESRARSTGVAEAPSMCVRRRNRNVIDNRRRTPDVSENCGVPRDRRPSVARAATGSAPRRARRAAAPRPARPPAQRQRVPSRRQAVASSACPGTTSSSPAGRPMTSRT